MLRKENFVIGEYYHIYSRTLLNIPEFQNKDTARKLAQTFLHANSTKSSQAFGYLRNNIKTSLENALEISKSGEKLTEILCYAIMPNHYHVLAKEIREKGITDFARKCNTSIAKYINTKTGRKGPLFESKFKSKRVDSNKYLLHLATYIHLNPLDFLENKDWRKNKINNWGESKKKLLNYPWSSIKCFINNPSSSSTQDFDEDIYSNIVSGTKTITDQFNGNVKNEYENFLQEWSGSDYSSTPDFDEEKGS